MQLAELRRRAAAGAGYICGFTDPVAAATRGLWDVCIDLDGGAVAVADEAQGEKREREREGLAVVPRTQRPACFEPLL